jgi:hypothetical protein
MEPILFEIIELGLKENVFDVTGDVSIEILIQLVYQGD